ncbi:type II toxin-antitoxin system YoeB family toxin [Cryobacterium sp. Sr8]|uniref:type II toxin-antitoxin system YoeB family toxin n=1 Tax=Cryobacterium sp. Sr8 TaxID=1259203 RepID=UPI001F540018|nr:type II toxin-antitoxin system YoeB family toxin [Cryobacterium sp. Sr8]
MFALIITIPSEIAAARIGIYALRPFGKAVAATPNAGVGSFLGNVVWVVLAGWWIAFEHLLSSTSSRASRIAHRASPSTGPAPRRHVHSPSDHRLQRRRLERLPVLGATDRAMVKRINKLIADVQRTPFTGIGKPEALEHQLTGYLSRRITD